MNILTVRKKPVVVQAVLVKEGKLEMPCEWCGGKIRYNYRDDAIGITVKTPLHYQRR